MLGGGKRVEGGGGSGEKGEGSGGKGEGSGECLPPPPCPPLLCRGLAGEIGHRLCCSLSNKQLSSTNCLTCE